MPEQTSRHPSRRWLMACLALVAGFVLSACGGSGAGSQGSAGSGADAPSSLVLTTSSPSLSSDGRSTATISAVVKDVGNRSMANQQVEFSTTDAGSNLQVVSSRTDATGIATATLSIADPTNRNITVSASTGGLRQTVAIAVVGTQLSLSGPSNLVSGAPNEYTVSLRDSAGAVIAARNVAISSAAGNTLSAASVTTDSAGQARFQVTGSRSGTDTLSLSALGATATLAIQVSSTQLSFITPTASQEIPVSVEQTVQVRFIRDGQPQGGQSIEFFSTRGVAIPANTTTDAEGSASATISSSTAGTATLTVRAGSVLSTQRIEFVSRTPAKLSLQPSPANVGVNLSATGTSSSQLIAVVRDAADNPVKGALVSFSALADPSNGRIEPATATTDATGVASVAFFPGANSTGNNQIRVQAAVVGSAIVGQSSLTASRQELVVRIGTGNVIEPLDQTRYAMPWTAAVTDSSGNPVIGAAIQASLVGVRFFKGSYYWSGTLWVPRGESADAPPFGCQSEDLNENLRLDPGEDLDGDGALDPANVAVASLSSVGGRTDETGFANLRVIYPREFANWTRVRLRVTITTLAGTEGVSERTFTLPVLAADVNNETTSPPGAVSPFGQLGDCRKPD